MNPKSFFVGPTKTDTALLWLMYAGAVVVGLIGAVMIAQILE